MSYSSKQQFIQNNWNKIEELEKNFIGYFKTVNANRIVQFLNQFELQHMPIALKLLENVDYYDIDTTSQLVTLLGTRIKKKTNRDVKNVYFCPMGESSGSSTDSILRRLRNEMRLDHPKYNRQFIRISDLKDYALETEQKYIVFVDDYAGSGKSFLDFWGRIGTWYNENHTYYLGLLVCSQHAVDNIENNTPVKIISTKNPSPKSEKVLDDENTLFSDSEKEILKQYCKKLYDSDLMQFGFRNTQSMIIFYERSSNNILPILYSRKNDWFPLFPRTRF